LQVGVFLWKGVTVLECEFYLGEAVQNDMRYISDRMREVRESFGESQMDFAETLEISRSTVARHEGGLGTISLDYLLRLLRATKTPAEKMFPPDLRGERNEFADLYAQLTEDNKYIVQNAVKSMMLGMLTTQKTKKKGLS